MKKLLYTLLFVIGVSSYSQAVFTPTIISTGSLQAGATFYVSSGTAVNLNVSTLVPVNVVGQTNTTAAPAGDVGEIIISSVSDNAPIPLTSGSAVSVATVTLTAGCWEMHYAFVAKTSNASTSLAQVFMSVSKTPGSLSGAGTEGNPSANGEIFWAWQQATEVPGSNMREMLTGPPIDVCIASTTPYYLVGDVVFTVSTCNGFGGIYARRIK